MQMQELLLKIRRKRYENAQVDVAQSRQALAQARQTLDQAERAVEAFVRERRHRIENIYNQLIGKEISRKILDEARAAERSLNEKLAAMKVDVKNCADQVEKKKKHLAEAQSRLIFSHKGMEKAGEIYQKAINENLRAENLREDEIIDEFAVRKKF